jgi:outer membrane protein insertion porin family
MVSLNTGTYFQGTEMAAEARVGLTNPTGHGERVTLSVEKVSEALGEVGASVALPRVGPGRAWTATADAHGRTRSWALSSSFDERSLGGGLRLTRDDGRHSVAYGAAWRTLADGTRHASGAVKAQAGHSLKSAVSYTGRVGRTVGVGPAEAGAVASYTAEVAGLGLGGGGSGGGGHTAGGGLGLVRHVRQAASASAHAPLGALWPSLFGPLGPGAAVGRAVGLHVSASAGLMVPWGGGGGSGGGGSGGSGRSSAPAATAATSLSDRFFLGGFGGLAGSSTLRGFGLRGVGPVDARHVPALSPVRGGGQAAASPPSSSPAPPPPPPPPPTERPWDFLGGDAVASVTAAARVALPWRWAQETGIFGHAFVNGGGLALLGGRGGESTGGVLAAVRAAAADSRWSAGVGLVWPTVAGNLEVDWVHVVRAKPSDVSRSGLSVGFTGRT